jgi:gliding motility-associated lipoprotein GldD
MRGFIYLSIMAAIVICLTASCNRQKSFTPKPTGYFRIDFPEKYYKTYNEDCPFIFDIPAYSFIVKEKQDYCWMDIYFPTLKAMIYLTYKPVENDLNTHLEDSREFVYKHTVMADAIEEIRFENDSLNVYGILYELSGNTASAVQFFLTDSTSHFLRGSLYFNVPPNKDSLAPVIDFIRDDIVYLMESFQWK